MYVRLVAPQFDRESRSPLGVFCAAGRLEDTESLQRYERIWLREALNWFNEHLPVPSCYQEGACRGAVCWFLDDAGEPLARIWDLVALLREHGTAVRLIWTTDPGTIVYQDSYQVVAFPAARRWDRRHVHRWARVRVARPADITRSVHALQAFLSSSA